MFLQRYHQNNQAVLGATGRNVIMLTLIMLLANLAIGRVKGFLEVDLQRSTYIHFAFVVLHSRGGGSWELVDAFSLCCLTWLFWKILAT